MKPKTLIPLVIGLAVGFFAIKMGLDMVQKAKGAQEDKATVYMAARSIDAAMAITENMLTTKQVPMSLVPADAFKDQKSLVGRVTKMQIPAGIPVTRAMLAPPGALPGLSAQIPPGHRAVSVKVTEETSVSGFITPGSRVDVSTVIRTNDGGTTSRLVLSNVEVGAVGQSLNTGAPEGGKSKGGPQLAKTVTLFLAPEDVQKLNAAIGTTKGGIRIALRGAESDPGDSFFAKMLTKMLEQQEAPAKPAKPKKQVKVAKVEPPKTHVVELRRGGAVEQLVFDERGGVRRIPMGEGGTVQAAPGTHEPQPAAGTMPGDAVEAIEHGTETIE
ncbi:MAG: Flp pilus assembly protein CpaB [Phycisphaerae bacterium]|nr:Flp pilus assembly protein CpaB [Phycisphaerae bacterium]